MIESVLAWLRRNGSKRNRDGLARYGLPSEHAFGVTVADLKVLAKRLGRSHELAAALWDSGWHEAHILSSFVDEPERVTPAQMDRWSRDFDNWGICDSVCFHLFDRTPYAWRKGRAAVGREERDERAHRCFRQEAPEQGFEIMNTIIASIRAEYLRYKALAEAAIGQLNESDLVVAGAGGGNSIAVLCWHLGGNLRSRFTDFLTTDGEKPWRKRDEEFQTRTVSRAELLAQWDRGWSVLLDTLSTLTDEDLDRTVTIRGQPLRVSEALHRSLAHMSYHVGQIVYIARGLRGEAWRFLSIPPGQSELYNAKPTLEKPDAHAASAHRQG